MALSTRTWDHYKHHVVKAGGRVEDDSSRRSHSEAQGYTMVLATLFKDRVQFDATWRWTQQTLQRPDRLFRWSWRNGQIEDQNNATDGDLLIAWALLRAGYFFQEPSYTAAGLEIGQAIQQKLIFSFGGLNLLKPGEHHASAGGQPLLNLSYLVAPALVDLAHVDPGGAWKGLLDDGVEMLRQNQFGRNLPADWARLSPNLQPHPYGQDPARFAYDACRIPLYIGWSLSNPQPLIQPCVDFWSSTYRPQVIYEFNTGTIADNANAGIHGIYQFARWLTTGQIPRFRKLSSELYKYYAGALLLLSQAAYEIRQVQAPFSRISRVG